MNEKQTSFFIGFKLKSGVFFVSLSLFLFPFPSLAAPKNDGILVRYKDSEEIQYVEVSDEDLPEKIKEYEEKENVRYAEPNYLYEATLIPSDVYYEKQWYLTKIKAPKAWDRINESKDVVIAIADSGIQITHPDLKENIWKNRKEIPDNNIDDDRNGFIDDINGWDFVDNTPDPIPKFEKEFTQEGILHGTIVAGIAGAQSNNRKGVSGITWKVQIMPLKVLNDAGEGDTRNVIRAIDYAIQNGADIINFSFIGEGYSKSLEEAIRRAYDEGIIIVAAAGNEQSGGSGYFLDNRLMYPVCHDGEDGENMVIGVAATDALDQKAEFSGYGSKCIDISAPGVSIFGLSVYEPGRVFQDYVFNKYYDGYWSGTSMAVPIVSAAAALVEGANPSLGRTGIMRYLKDNADDINGINAGFAGKLGSGRINLFRAVSNAEYSLISQTSRLIVTPKSNRKSELSILKIKGDIDKEFAVYAENFRGGVNVATGDIDGDGINEIITGAGFGGGPHVRIFDRFGKIKSQFFAYNKNFRGGVNVAAGDVDGDGLDEIITGAGNTGGPHVRIFDLFGKPESQFFAYAENFRGGVNVAAGDVDGDGLDEIITGAGERGGPQVRIFDGHGRAEGQFFAYAENFRGGVNVAVGDIDGGIRNHRDEIVTSPGPGGGPHVRIFTSQGNVKKEFFAYNKNFRGGVSIYLADFNQDGYDDIITGAGEGGAPHVIVFKNDGKVLSSFYAYEEDFSDGVNVSAITY